MDKTICDTHDDIGEAILAGDEETALELLSIARKMGERMESRLTRYKRAIELLGFKRDRK
jgi:hypothetical protein